MYLDYPEPDSDAANTVRTLSAGPPSQGQPHQPPSSSDAHAARGASPPPKATPDKRVPEEDDGGGASTEHPAKVVAPDAPSGKKIARSEDERLIELERQLSETLVAKTERDQRIAQLTEELTRAEADAAEEKNRAGLELRELQAKFDESLLSRDQAIEQAEQAEANAEEERERAGLELRGLQANLDELLLSRDHALERAKADAAEERERAGLELRKLQAKLDKSLSRDHALERAEERERARLELRELQAKLQESLLSCDHALEQAQSALQKASYAAEANEQSQRELTEMRAKLEAEMSESTLALRLRLADTGYGCAESKAEADTYRTQTATGLVNTDELMERMQALEDEMASLQCAVERDRF